MGSRHLEALEIPARQEVRYARHGVRAIDGGRAFLDNLDTVQSDRRERVDVHETASLQADRDVHVTAAVQQDQRARRPDAPEIDAGHRFGHRGGRPGRVPSLPVSEHARAGAQVPEEIDRLRGSLFCEGSAPGNRDGIGKVDRRLLEGGPGHHHLLQLESGGMQPEFDEHGAVCRDNHVLGSGQVADNLGAHFVRAGGHAHEDEPPLGERLHAGAQLGYGNLHRLDRLTAHGVGHDPGNGAGRLGRCGVRGTGPDDEASEEGEGFAGRPRPTGGMPHDATLVQMRGEKTALLRVPPRCGQNHVPCGESTLSESMLPAVRRGLVS